MEIRIRKYNNHNFPVKSNRLFELLLGLSEKLEGQSIKINSPFTKDKTPSFVIYFSTEGLDNYYRYKDFSGGTSGDAIDLFILLHGSKYKIKDRQDAYYKILEILEKNGKLSKYSSETAGEIVEEKKEITRYTLSEKWTKEKANYWRDYGITKELITEYCIKPLDHYELTITRGQHKDVKQFSPTKSFAYLKKDGTLYKIYNTGQKIAKFVKVTDCIQGYEQLKPNKKYCIIFSSLKDALSFLGLGYTSFNVLVADSENVMLHAELILELKASHEKVFCLFDNDTVGYKGMINYRNVYQIEPIHFTVEKDFAQCRYDHGPENTKLYFNKAFKQTIERLKKASL